ncbi:unnamed protein product [Cylicocyclus nassatus]|uniref:Uncharacterized protein n=1 Tax=Cylicocyclus nassatus TaxID=53992 RepID=A0AA36DRH3_CYLNA|nr:unnamed protein product [Cylicocyclus nassatus]
MEPAIRCIAEDGQCTPQQCAQTWVICVERLKKKLAYHSMVCARCPMSLLYCYSAGDVGMSAQRVSHLGADVSFSFACGKSQIPSKVSVAHSPFFQASNWSAMYVRTCS